MRFLKKKTEINPNAFVSCSGRKKKKVFAPFYDGKKLTLVENGEIDIPSIMSERAKMCDMNYILSRLAHGDLSVFHSAQPMYADFHNLPSNFREVLDIGLNAERIFNSLPVTTRQQFDNDYRRFVSSAGSGEWNSIMSPFIGCNDDNTSSKGNNPSSVLSPDVVIPEVVSPDLKVE